MKKLRIAVLLVTVISLTGLFLACPSGGSSTTPPVDTDETPVATDFTITGTGNFVDIGTPQFVDVVATPKSGKSTGAITYNYYDATGAKVAKPAPTALGTYNVTFNVAASTGWKAGVDLNAGFVSIGKSEDQEPDILDFTITGFPVNIAVGDPAPAVSITAKSGKTTGAITIVYTDNAGNQTTGNATGSNMPTAAGLYSASFNVAAATGWRPKSGFAAGYVYIRTPVDPDEPTILQEIEFSDFIITFGTEIFTDENTALRTDYTDAPQDLKIVGSTQKGIDYLAAAVPPLGSPPVKVFKNSASTIIDPPTAVGNYTVTVTMASITDAANKIAFTSLYLRDFPLEIKKRKPTSDDFTYGNKVQAQSAYLLQNQNTVTDITVINKSAVPTLLTQDAITAGASGTSKIIITRRYAQTAGANATDFATTLPSLPGTYNVQFDVRAKTTTELGSANDWGNTWLDATNLTADPLTILPLVTFSPDFSGGQFWLYEDGVKIKASEYYVAPNDPINFSVDPSTKSDYTVVGWKEDGKPAGTGPTYQFKKYALGWHEVTLVMKDAAGNLYSDTVQIRVQVMP